MPDLAQLISASPSIVTAVVETVHVRFDPAVALPGGKRLLSLTVESERISGRTVVYGTAVVPRGDSGSHRVELPRSLAALFTSYVQAA
jgi:hypothetical protein